MLKLLPLFFLFLLFSTSAHAMDNSRKRKRDDSLMQESNAKRVKVSPIKNKKKPTSPRLRRSKRKREDRSQESESKRVKLDQREIMRRARAKYFSQRYTGYIFYYSKDNHEID